MAPLLLLVVHGPAIGVSDAAGPSQRTRTPPASAVPRAVDQRPNIVLVLSDDQRADTLSVMPNVRTMLAAQGTTYTRAMVPTSLCCPSRATILTGLYAHTSRMYGNGDVGGVRHGGWPRFHQLGLEARTLGPALKAQGYRTGLIGKYLNYFGHYAPTGYVPPGWDTFAALMSNHGSYYGYRLSDGTSYGRSPEAYSTDVLSTRATDFISTTPPDQPLFLYFAPFGPHAPYVPAPRHFGVLDGQLTPYLSGSLHQPLRSMPRWMARRDHVTQGEVNLTRQRQLETLMSVDDAVGSIERALEQAGRDRDTLFIFTSDNGYFWGEHRIIGKDTPYRQSTAVPMVVRWDGHTPPSTTSGRIVLNVDLASTIARAAGARMPTDGLDILGSATRTGFPLEAMRGYNHRPAYCGYRTVHRMYVQWETGEEELYDYRSDPAERFNLAKKPAFAKVKARMRALAKSSCSPRPPGFRWSTRLG